MNARQVEISRRTAETEITVKLDLDGDGRAEIATGLGFLDHMLTSLTRHAGWNLTLTCRGDLVVDDHHTAEDCALVLGRAIDQVVRSTGPVQRFGWARVPMDDALADVAVDLGGRPWPVIDLGLVRPTLGTMATENLTHFMVTLAMEARCNLHVDLVRGDNDHHRAEAAFKGLALAMAQALTARLGPVRSTKEVIA
jgi:imidazoleglycerol phosphate dehydratase HisB